MTTKVIELPTGDNADDTVRQTVRALITGRGMRVEDVAPLCEMTPSTLYRRLAGKGSKEAFKAGEVAKLARFFDVDVSDIFSGFGGAFSPPTNPTPGAGGSGKAALDELVSRKRGRTHRRTTTMYSPFIRAA